MWLWPCQQVKVQVWVQSDFNFLNDFKCHIFSLSWNMTSDDLWPWCDLWPCQQVEVPMLHLWPNFDSKLSSFSYFPNPIYFQIRVLSLVEFLPISIFSSWGSSSSDPAASALLAILLPSNPGLRLAPVVELSVSSNDDVVSSVEVLMIKLPRLGGSDMLPVTASPSGHVSAVCRTKIGLLGFHLYYYHFFLVEHRRTSLT